MTIRDTTGPSTVSSDRSDGSLHQNALLAAATQHLFQKNAFRITGLPVDATLRNIGKQAERLKLLAELGQDPQSNAVMPLRPGPTVEDIRDAIQRLKDPEKRLIDEFFWFWPQEFGESRSDAAIQALETGDLETAADIWMSKRKHPTEGVVATHNLALVFHVSALDWENKCLTAEIDANRRKQINEYWTAAFYRWNRIATTDELWEKVAARIRQLSEPNLTTGVARRMRTSLPIAFKKINAALAVAFANAGKTELAQLQIQLMQKSGDDPAAFNGAAEVVLAPFRSRIKEQIRQARERAAKSATDGVSAGRDLIDQCHSSLALFDLFFGKESELRRDTFDEVASACNQLQVIYNKATRDNTTCIEFLRTILPLAASPELRQQIESNIETATENLAYLQFKLKIRGDEIEITPEKFRYNNDVLSTTDISGIRYGVFRQRLQGSWVNEIPTSTSYQIVVGGNRKVINIECKRFFRSEKQAEQDFGAILNAIYAHIVPSLCTRLATQIVGGARLSFGAAPPCYLTKEGVYVTTGVLRWKKEQLIRWSDVRFAADPGRLTVWSAAASGLAQAFSLREVWNAVIFKELANEIVTRRGPVDEVGKKSSAPVRPAPVAKRRITPRGYLALGIFSVFGLLFVIGLISGPQSSSINTSRAAERREIESERAQVQALESDVGDLAREIERDRLYLDRSDEFQVQAFNAKVRRYNALLAEAQNADNAFNQKVDNYNAKVRGYPLPSQGQSPQSYRPSGSRYTGPSSAGANYPSKNPNTGLPESSATSAPKRPVWAIESNRSALPASVPQIRSIGIVKISGNDTLNVRADASAASAIIGTLRNGEQVYLDAKRVHNNEKGITVNWQKITTLGGNEGWVNADYIASPSQ